MFVITYPISDVIADFVNSFKKRLSAVDLA